MEFFKRTLCSLLALWLADVALEGVVFGSVWSLLATSVVFSVLTSLIAMLAASFAVSKGEGVSLRPMVLGVVLAQTILVPLTAIVLDGFSDSRMTTFQCWLIVTVVSALTYGILLGINLQRVRSER